MSIDPTTIDLLVLDVDGVLTDGRIIYDDAGGELKMFHVQDGSGLKYWHRAGKRSAILTGRRSGVVDRRAAELGVSLVRQGSIDKLPALREILAEMRVDPARAAYMGDDLPDLPAMRICGLKIGVPNAVEEIQAVADWIAPVPGGHGAVRWAIEKLLRESGLWATVMARYA
ncbi:MAG: HAD hydrolase family protein [Planctomycetes bacterium]|nr:HAD hydrolase family protein [Planctomycetota bacterium]